MIIAIVPAYNEESSIASVVRSLFCHVDEVVVIDDASQDNTVQMALAGGATVLEHKINRGQGAALETGHEYARHVEADLIVHFDADGQFNANDIPGAISFLQKNEFDIVFGSRYLDNRSDVPWLKRHIVTRVGRLVNALSGAPELSDVHNGFRVMNNNALHRVKISQDRMAHATQIPVLVNQWGLSYGEYPVEVKYFEFGQGFRSGLIVIKDLVTGVFIEK